ncbi:MAG: uroporphyrinogen decarboxylase [Candidatus Lokiarchaeota archaeon]|nr:uroporphyrinogen decarboxylase [Candidatus Lokiarchaeota archaeon]
MNGKQRILATFDHEVPDHVPWIPFAGIHAGKLKGYTATELLTDKDKLVECLLEVNKAYSPDGQPVAFDLQVEAEILGCKMRWADKAPPSVETHPLAGKPCVPSTIPVASDGRLPLFLHATRQLKAKVGASTAIFGLITGPLTLASHLRGTTLFVDMIRQKSYVRELLAYACDVATAMASLYMAAGADIIAVVDPVVSQVSPKAFEDLLHDPFARVFRHIKEQGVRSSFFVCGDATKNIEPMCRTRPESIFVDENIDMVAAKKITDKNGIVIGGNIPLTSTLLYGTQQDNMKYVIDQLDALGTRNLVVAPGCDMPYDVPPENVVGVVQAVHEPNSVREMLRNYQATSTDAADVVVPDYAELTRPMIEVFTIDSAQCAACGYMKSLAFTAKERYGDAVDVVEYKSIDKANIARAKRMGIKHLPCILIDGKLKYSSIIPPQADYFKEIESSLKKRNR